MTKTPASALELAAHQALAGAGQAFFRPASTGLVPDTVSPARLQNANSLLATSEQGSNVVGPVLAGALITLVGPAWAIALDACTYGASALFLARLQLDESSRMRPTESFLADLAGGFAEFRSRSWLVALVGEYALCHLAFFAPFYVLGPTVAHRELGGVAAWATILALYGGGAIAGAAGALRL